MALHLTHRLRAPRRLREVPGIGYGVDVNGAPARRVILRLAGSLRMTRVEDASSSLCSRSTRPLAPEAECHHPRKRTPYLVPRTILLALAAALAFLAPEATAQGTVQTQLIGVPPSLSSPYLSELARDVEIGRYPLQILYSAPTAAPLEVRLNLAITLDGAPLAEAESEPFEVRPGVTTLPLAGPDVSFVTPLETLLATVSGPEGETIRQTGALPEGLYQLTAEAVPTDPAQFVTPVAGTAVFTVRYAQPPIPITPPEQTTVIQDSPVFAWTAVSAAPGADVVYEFRLAPILPLQTPLDALLANRPWAQVTLSGSSLAYFANTNPPTSIPSAGDVLPQRLTPGQLYAWQVVARDENRLTAFVDDGASEVRTFLYDPSASGGGTYADLDFLALEPGFARLTGLRDAILRQRLTLDIDEFGARLDGTVTLELLLPDGPVTQTVQVNDLEIQRVGNELPVLVAGGLSARVSQRLLAGLGDGLDEVLRLRDVEWSVGNGFTLTDPQLVIAGQTIRSTGTVRLTRNGVAGTLVAEDASGLVSLGEDPASLVVTRVQTTFPSGETFADGRLQLFRGPECDLGRLTLTGSDLTAQASCIVDETLTLTGDTFDAASGGLASLALTVGSVRGTLTGDLASGDFTPTLSADLTVALDAPEAACSALVTVDISASGATARDLRPSCNAGTLDLGIARLDLAGIDLSGLGYTARGAAQNARDAGWKLASLGLDAAIDFPALGVSLPQMSLGLSARGLEIPAITASGVSLGARPVTLGGFGLDLTELSLPDLTIPMPSLGGIRGAADSLAQEADSTARAWRFALKSKLKLPDSPALPACLRNREVDLGSAGYADGELTLPLAGSALGGCRLEIAPGTAVVIERLGGEVTASISLQGLDVRDSALDLAAQLELGAPFSCANALVPDADLTLRILQDGTLSAFADLPALACPFPLGPLEGTVTRARLTFERTSGGATAAYLASDIEIALSETDTAVGFAGFDLDAARIDTLSATVDGPFQWAVPSPEAAALTFEIQNATLGLQGIAMDGRQKLLFSDGSEIGATFDAVRVPFDRVGLDGRILFDAPFALQAGLDDFSTPTFRAVPDTASLDLSPGALLSLGQSVEISAGQIRTSGAARAAVQAGPIDAEALVDFRDFGLDLFPFEVASGAASFATSTGTPVAILDASGFRLDPAFAEGLLPDTLGLPTKDVAYIVLRDAQGNSLVDVQDLGTGGIAVSTRGPLALVVLALRAATGQAPSVAVQFTDLNLDASGQVSAGEVRAALSPTLSLEPYGIPFEVRELVYGEQEVSGVPTWGLHLGGDPIAFEQSLGDSGAASLLLSPSRVRGTLALQNLGADVLLAGDLAGAGAVLTVDRLDARIDVPLALNGSPDIAMTVGADFALRDGQAQEIAGVGLEAVARGTSFQVTSVTPRASIDGRRLDAGPLALRVDSLRTLQFTPRPNQTPSFEVGLDLTFLLDVEGPEGATQKVAVPLQSATVNNNGFRLPAQSLSASGQPALSVPPVEFGPLSLEIAALRLIRDLRLPWALAVPDLTALRADLLLRLDELAQSAPALGDDTILLNDVGYDNGVWVGTMEPYTFDDQATVTLNPASGAAFTFQTAAGRLYRDGASQGIELTLTGELDPPSLFAPEAACTPADVTVTLNASGDFTGLASPFVPCGSLTFGPAEVAFAATDPAAPNVTSTLAIRLAPEAFSASYDGVLVGTWARDNAADLRAVGRGTVNLLTGDLDNGFIDFAGPLALGVPFDDPDPLFAFTVDGLRLTQDRVQVTGGGTIDLPGAPQPATVSFTDFAVGFSGEVVGGSATIQGSAALDLTLDAQLDWSVVSTQASVPVGAAARLAASGQITVTPQGVGFDAGGTGFIAYNGDIYSNLDLDFRQFQIGLDPVRVASGVVDFEQNGNRIAYLDASGFHADFIGAALALIPERIALPSEDIAYLDIGADAENNPRILVTRDANGTTVATAPNETIDLVIPAIGQTTVQASFSVTMDDLGNVSTASLTLAGRTDLSGPTGLPVTLTALSYANGQLSAAMDVDLPASLTNADFALSATVSARGLDNISGALGQFAAAYDASQENVTPIYEESFGPVRVALRGADVASGANGTALRLSGQIYSSLFEDENDDPQPIHLVLAYTNGTWSGDVDAGNLPADGIDMDFATFEPIPDTNDPQSVWDFTLDDQKLALSVSGLFKTDLLGDGFALTVRDLTLTTEAPYVTVDAQGDLPPQALDMFGGVLRLTATDIGASVVASGPDVLLAVELDGSATLLDKSLTVDGLRVRSDGDVSLASGEAILFRDIAVIPDAFVVDEVSIVAGQNVANGLALQLAATATLPAPVASSASMTASIDRTGRATINGPTFVFTEGNAPEADLGDFGTLAMTGAALDLDFNQPAQSALLATGVLYVENDRNDPAKHIYFGQAADILTDFGLRATASGEVAWRVSSASVSNSSPLEFEYDFFSFALTALQIETNVQEGQERLPFRLTLGGRAGFSLDAVEGSAGFEGFTVSTRGVEDIGRFSGGATFTLSEIFSLTVGEFVYAENETIQMERRASGARGSAETEMVDVAVRQYLRFGNGAANPALRISFTDAFVGGIAEVLFYEETNGAFEIALTDVEMAMSDLASLKASMRYRQVPNDGFLFEVAGGGTFGTTSFGAAGKISTLNDELRFGIFAAAGVQVPIIPVLIELDGFGGGFFYKPEQSDFALVETALAGMTSDGRPFHLVGPTPEVSDLTFAAFLYAGVGIVKPQGLPGLMEGHVLLTITDQFTKLDVNTTMYAQDGPGGAPGSNLLAADMYLTILYGSGASGVEGGVTLLAQFGPALDAEAGLDFFAVSRDNGPVVWGIDGYLDADILSFLTADGDFMAGPDGMLMELNVEVSGDLAIVSAEAGMDLLVWNLPNGTNPFGAYAGLYIGFDVLGGLASLRADAKGLFLKRPNVYEVYLAGSAYVEVLFVFEGTIAGWVKGNSRGDVDWGTGRNADLDAAIQQARADASGAQAKAQEAQQEMDSAKAELEAAQAALAAELANPANYRVSAADLRLAGAHLLLANKGPWNVPQSAARGSILDDVIADERALFGNAAFSDPSTYPGWLYTNVMRGSTSDRQSGYYGQRSAATPFAGNAHSGPQPGVPVSQASADAIAQQVQAVTQEATQVSQRLAASQPILSSLANQLRDATASGDPADFNVRNPVSNIRPAVVGAGGQVLQSPGFVFDAAAFQQDSTLLAGFDEDIVALNLSYQDALGAAAASARLVDLVLDGASAVNWGAGLPDISAVETTGAAVNAVGYGFVEATLDLDSYYAYAVQRLWDLREWASTREGLLPSLPLASGGAMRTAVRDASYWPASWTGSTLTSRLDRISAVGAERLRAIWRFNGNTGEGTTRANNFIASVNTLRQRPNDTALLNSVRTTFNQAADQFWLEMPKRGLGEVVTATESAVQDLVAAYDAQRPALTTAHAAFTSTIDEMYGLKAGMLVSTYGMIEQYEAWRTDAGIPAASGVRNARAQVVDALAPPDISHLRLEGGETDTGLRTAEVIWGVGHPVGVPELSYAFRVNGPSLVSVYDDVPYLTSGTASLGDGWFPNANIAIQEFPMLRRSRVQTAARTTLYARARSAGGVTATRFVQATVPLADGGNATQGSSGSASGGSDATPPEAPSASLPNTRRAGTTWAPDASRLDLVLTSRDPESGIAQWEVALGTTRGGTDVRNWEVFQGDRTADSRALGWGGWGAGESISGTLFGLDLGLTPVYLSVRATNGDGDVSTVYTRYEGITHDATPPEVSISVAPAASVVIPPAGPAVQRPAANSRSDWDAQRIEFDTSDIDNTTLDVTWTGADAESGIDHFDVGYAGASGAARFDSTQYGVTWNEVSPFTSRTASVPFRFDGSYVVMLRAQNKAGGMSGTIATRPIRRADPTRPTTPIVTVWPALGGPVLTLSRVSRDNESGIAGYQVAVGTAPGLDDLRAWPRDSLAVDWTVPDDVALLPAAQHLSWTYARVGEQWISVRAVNGQGIASRATTTRVQHDPTPPVLSAASVTFSRDASGRVSAQVRATPPEDPESGIAATTVRVRVPRFAGRTLSGAATVFEVHLAPTGTASAGLTPAQIARLPASGAEIAVTVESRNTLGRTATQTVWMAYQPAQAQQEAYGACMIQCEASGESAERCVRECLQQAGLPEPDDLARLIREEQTRRRAAELLTCLNDAIRLDPQEAIVSCRQRLRLPDLDRADLERAVQAEEARRTSR